MEITLSILLVFMIIGAVYALFAKDLLSALISCGIVGYGLVICFLLLKAPDLAIVQIVVETITLIIMVAIVLDSTREELKESIVIREKGIPFINARYVFNVLTVAVLTLFFQFFFSQAIDKLEPLGQHVTRMASGYMEGAAEKTGSANLVTGIIFDFRGYDTLGEATILFTAVIGVLTILRLKGRKEPKN
jgi:multicomponent Na+:H+ antiporter subunit B